MNVRNPDITGPCRHLKTGAGYALNPNISRTQHSEREVNRTIDRAIANTIFLLSPQSPSAKGMIE
jgi:hypothetical protein